MSETESFKLDDFPPELLERFIPDLRPETVSKMRLVNRRFRDVFCADRFYKPYVRFGTTLADTEAEDAEEEGEAGGDEASDVSEDPGARKGPWRRCLEAEKRCLENWKTSRAERAYAVDIPAEDMRKLSPPCGKVFWQGLVGQKGDYWLLAELEGNAKIVLVCATDEPVFAVIDVSPHTKKVSKFAFLLPDQVLIDSGGMGHVFNIRKHGESLSLEHFFEIDQFRGGLCSSSGPLSRGYSSLYVVPSSPNGTVLRVWDLQTAVRLGNIVLPDLLPSDALDISQIYNLNVTEVEQLLVLVRIEGFFKRWRILCVVVDVEKGQLTFWCHEDRASLVDFCAFSGNIFLLQLLVGNHSQLRLFDRNDLKTDLSQSPVLFQHRSQNYFHVHLDSSTLVLSITGGIQAEENPYESIRKILVVKVAGTEVTHFEIDLEAMNYAAGHSSISHCSVIGPFLVVRLAEKLLSLDFTGKLLFDWNDLLSYLGVPSSNENFRISDDGVKFNSISKCVLQNSNGGKLLICYF